MQIRPNQSCSYVWMGILLFLVFQLVACGDGENSANVDDSRNGSASFRLLWSHSSGDNPAYPLESPSGDVCIDYEIETIHVALTDSAGTLVEEANWPCSDRKGTLTDIPPASGMTLTISGSVDGKVNWQAEVTPLEVKSETDTDLGTVVMQYTGEDNEPPAVETHYPAAGALDIALRALIRVTFSEDVVAASIDESSCTVSETGATDPISVSVSYDSALRTATITPGTDLSSNTEHTVSIKQTVQDKAGNEMGSDVDWTFTTGTSTTSPPVADAGSDQNAMEGDLVTLDGSGSLDPDGTITSYLWEQEPGETQVELSGTASVVTSFTAPDVDTGGETLNFHLTVTDNDDQTSTDIISVHITSQDESLIWDKGNWDKALWK